MPLSGNTPKDEMCPKIIVLSSTAFLARKVPHERIFSLQVANPRTGISTTERSSLRMAATVP